MIHLFVNAFAASAGGGLTYVRNVVPVLGTRADIHATVLISPDLRQEFGSWENVTFIQGPRLSSAAARFWFEQTRLPGIIRQSGATVLLSTGNFVLWNAPVPQILLSRNALYTSTDFEDDLRRRGDYRLWLDTKIKGALAKASIQRADLTVAPSATFAEELSQWTGKNVIAIHHGFDAEAFTRNKSPLPQDVQDKLSAISGNLRLLFVSHYNYYRNFETLISALPLLRARLAPRKVSLMLTCKLRSESNPGSYSADSAAALVCELGVSDNVVELGSIPYSLLHHVYRSCDIYVSPAYAESFAHPLLEAMACGVPVVASDIPVHREICGDVAHYFERFSGEDLASTALQVATMMHAVNCLSTSAVNQSQTFSWSAHIEQVVALARREFSRD